MDLIAHKNESYLISSVSFAIRHPSVVWNLLTFATCGSVAQVFIFACLEEYGGFITTTICTSRKVLQVVLSILIFPPKNPIVFIQWLGFLNVIGGLALQSVCSGGVDLGFLPSSSSRSSSTSSKKQHS